MVCIETAPLPQALKLAFMLWNLFRAGGFLYMKRKAAWLKRFVKR